MSCLVCRQTKFLPARNEEDCLEVALECVRNHVKFFRNTANEQEQRCQLLQERNEKLTQAVQLLQRQQKQQPPPLPAERKRSAQDYSPRKKRSKTSCTLNISDGDGDDEEATPASQSQLNMALNSQQLDSSALSISPGGGGAEAGGPATTKHSDSIAETERTERSPRKLRTPAQWQRQQKQQLQKNASNENRNPLAALHSSKKETTDVAVGALKKSTTWLSKDRASASISSTTSAENQWAERFIKPQAVLTKAATSDASSMSATRNEKKQISLSLNKRSGSKKLHQSRLQLDVAPRGERSFSGAESTFCEDVIDASPNAHAATKQPKVARSWLLRTGNCSSSSGKGTDASRSSLQNGQLLTISDSDDDVFDMHYTKTTETKPTRFDAQSLDATDAQIEFELRPDIAADATTTATDNILLQPVDTSTSSSVVMLTPGTQDIIFLDDTTRVVEATPIKSMDLLDLLMRKDDTTNLARMKRLENDRIKKLQFEEEDKVDTAKNDNPETKESLKVKEENISLANVLVPSTKIDEQSSSEEMDAMPRPITLKEEPLSPVLSVEERFNINCHECRNFIKFFRHTMSDADIEARLRKCQLHNNVRPGTPEGFWNPFILSFAADDPRNEVLIDDRFIGKKRNS